MAGSGGPTAKTEAEMSAESEYAEVMRRMTLVIHHAIREHVEVLTTDRGRTRFLEVLQALGLDERTRYFARRSAQLCSAQLFRAASRRS